MVIYISKCIESYKISTLVGELYRCSTPEALNKALDVTKNIFLKNQYPLKLINEKISDLKRKKISTFRIESSNKWGTKNTENTSYTVSLPFTSCDVRLLLVKLKKYYASTPLISN